MGLRPTQGNENRPRPSGRKGTPWRAPTAFALGDFQETAARNLALVPSPAIRPETERDSSLPFGCHSGP